MRESYGAVLAHHRVSRARDVVARSALAAIAVDESSHAALSWDIHHWALTRLGSSDRANIESALIEERLALAGELACGPNATLRHELGWPDADVAIAMHHALCRALPITPAADAAS